jgi:hypothetical protein
MTPEQFCYWLQGRAELQPDKAPSAAEWTMIREHLGTVFAKVTPPLQQYFPRSPTDAAPNNPWVVGTPSIQPGTSISHC